MGKDKTTIHRLNVNEGCIFIGTFDDFDSIRFSVSEKGKTGSTAEVYLTERQLQELVDKLQKEYVKKKHKELLKEKEVSGNEFYR